MSSIATTSLNLIFSLVSTFMKILLAPLDLIIMNYLPDVSDMIDKLGDFLTLCMTFIGWVIDAFGIPATAISLIIAYFVLKYSIHMTVIVFKIIFSWVRSLI